MKRLLPLLAVLIVCSCGSPAPEGEYQEAPFSGLDTLATNDWWSSAGHRTPTSRREQKGSFPGGR